MGVRRCKKEDLKRIARVTGATLVSTFADMDGNESFDTSMLGYVWCGVLCRKSTPTADTANFFWIVRFDLLHTF